MTAPTFRKLEVKGFELDPANGTHYHLLEASYYTPEMTIKDALALEDEFCYTLFRNPFRKAKKEAGLGSYDLFLPLEKEVCDGDIDTIRRNALKAVHVDLDYKHADQKARLATIKTYCELNKLVSRYECSKTSGGEYHLIISNAAHGLTLKAFLNKQEKCATVFIHGSLDETDDSNPLILPFSGTLETAKYNLYRLFLMVRRLAFNCRVNEAWLVWDLPERRNGKLFSEIQISEPMSGMDGRYNQSTLDNKMNLSAIAKDTYRSDIEAYITQEIRNNGSKSEYSCTRQTELNWLKAYATLKQALFFANTTRFYRPVAPENNSVAKHISPYESAFIFPARAWENQDNFYPRDIAQLERHTRDGSVRELNYGTLVAKAKRSSNADTEFLCSQDDYAESDHFIVALDDIASPAVKRSFSNLFEALAFFRTMNVEPSMKLSLNY